MASCSKSTPSAALYYANYYAPLPGVKEGIVQDGEPGTPACEEEPSIIKGEDQRKVHSV